MRALLILVLAILPSCAQSPAAKSPADQATIVAMVLPSVVSLHAGRRICTGVAYTPRRIATSDHCVPGEEPWVARTVDGREIVLRLVGRAGGKHGVAVAEIGPSEADLPFVSLSDHPLRQGEPVIVIGHPYGQFWTITTGVVSYIGRTDGIGGGPLLQFSAPVVPGNSGGPVLTADGRWVGVVDSVFGMDGIVAHIGYAYPADSALAAIREIEGRK